MSARGPDTTKQIDRDSLIFSAMAFSKLATLTAVIRSRLSCKLVMCTLADGENESVSFACDVMSSKKTNGETERQKERKKERKSR